MSLFSLTLYVSPHITTFHSFTFMLWPYKCIKGIGSRYQLTRHNKQNIRRHTLAQFWWDIKEVHVEALTKKGKGSLRRPLGVGGGSVSPVRWDCQ